MMENVVGFLRVAAIIAWGISLWGAKGAITRRWTPHECRNDRLVAAIGYVSAMLVAYGFNSLASPLPVDLASQWNRLLLAVLNPTVGYIIAKVVWGQRTAGCG